MAKTHKIPKTEGIWLRHIKNCLEGVKYAHRNLHKAQKVTRSSEFRSQDTSEFTFF